jgi:hypothetical protein
MNYEKCEIKQDIGNFSHIKGNTKLMTRIFCESPIDQGIMDNVFCYMTKCRTSVKFQYMNQNEHIYEGCHCMIIILKYKELKSFVKQIKKLRKVGLLVQCHSYVVETRLLG